MPSMTSMPCFFLSFWVTRFCIAISGAFVDASCKFDGQSNTKGCSLKNESNTDEVVQLQLKAARPTENEGCVRVGRAGKCPCVESPLYEDKCAACMCGKGSTMWCNTACDPTGDTEAERRSSCCQPFKKLGEPCGQNWECGLTRETYCYGGVCSFIIVHGRT
eukprot:TRINITY_DN9600_c0_g1_i1.p1 TRINITY_DN9600_c0_g1~~TRINITY_DN9600_c0_g1_i1.p1  ORF type:complete len:162 (-),score=14.20 TRINITY_DN9600_c0_g1_i1:7-492(-)